jgi:hypothetical protein
MKNTIGDGKTGLLMQYPRKYQVKKVMKFQVLKVESANTTMSGIQFSWLIYDSSNNINYVLRFEFVCLTTQNDLGQIVWYKLPYIGLLSSACKIVAETLNHIETFFMFQTFIKKNKTFILRVSVSVQIF